MGNHDNDSSRHTYQSQAGYTKKDKAHVSDTGITNQKIQILLTHGNPSVEENVAQAKIGHDLHPTLRCLGHHRQRNPDETIQAKFLERTGMEHRCSGWSRAVTDRRPGVEWPQRDQNAEAKEQEWKDQMLR